MELAKSPLNLIIAGVGGQGNVLASELLATAATEAGYRAVVGETFGVSQRGGAVMSHVRVFTGDAVGPLVPRGQADIVVGFEPLEALRVLLDYGHPGARALVNRRPSYPLAVLHGEAPYPPPESLAAAIREITSETRDFPATDLAEQAGNYLAQNLVMLGALAGTGWIAIPVGTFRSVIAAGFAGEARDLNQRAFALGLAAATGEGYSLR